MIQLRNIFPLLPTLKLKMSQLLEALPVFEPFNWGWVVDSNNRSFLQKYWNGQLIAYLGITFLGLIFFFNGLFHFKYSRAFFVDQDGCSVSLLKISAQRNFLVLIMLLIKYECLISEDMPDLSSLVQRRRYCLLLVTCPMADCSISS